MEHKDYLIKVKQLNDMADAYYTLDNPIATDYEYDMLYKEVVEYEEANPNKISKDSPTQRVGDRSADNFTKIKHLTKMWSLSNVFNLEELENWVKGTFDFNIHVNDNKFIVNMVCDAKYDGCSLNLIYDKGILQQAITRGDGTEGEDVLHNVKTMDSIPLGIPYKGKIEIRGEVVISKSDFELVNQERIANNEPVFANPRNAASGSLRVLDPEITKKRKLQFIVWGYGYHSTETNSFSHNLIQIKSLGFKDAGLWKVCESFEDIKNFIELVTNYREAYDLPLDGIVIRYDAIDKCNSMGYTAKAPKFAVAYKFKAVEKQTKLLDIELNVGRTGVITPVGILEPVEIDGSVVSRVTLHNFAEIEKKDIRIGDTIGIIKSGEIIPKVACVLTSLRTGNEKVIDKPTICPSCGSNLKNVLNLSLSIVCENTECKARAINRIIHYSSKRAMNIIGLGDKAVEFLYDNNIVKSIEDLYKLTSDKLQGYEGWGEVKINNLLSSIERTKNIELWRFIHALGIPHVGERASKDICNKLGLKVFEVNFDQVMSIPNIGTETTIALTNYMVKNKKELDYLRNILNLITNNTELVSDVLGNETICITGSLSKPRDAVADMLRSYGANVVNSINKKTTILLVGEGGGSKLSKAKELNVKVMTENEIYNLINGE